MSFTGFKPAQTGAGTGFGTAPAASPFGAPAPATPAASPPFGGFNTATTSTPFASAAPAATPFGQATTTNTGFGGAKPLGATQSTTFGTTQALGTGFGMQTSKPATGFGLGTSTLGVFGTAGATSGFGGGFGMGATPFQTAKPGGSYGIFSGQQQPVPGLPAQQGAQQAPPPTNPVLQELDKLKQQVDKTTAFYRLKTFFYNHYEGPREPGRYPQESLGWGGQIDARDEETKQLLFQAMTDNPDPNVLVPQLTRGPDGLSERLKAQAERTNALGDVVVILNGDIAEMEKKQSELEVMRKKCLDKHADLERRILKATCRLDLANNDKKSLSDIEMDLLTKLEALKVQLDDPTQFRGRLLELQQRRGLLDVSDVTDTIRLPKDQANTIAQHMSTQQEGLDCLTNILKEDLEDLHIIMADLSRVFAG
eukprot:comp19773_c0_seq1/m.23679 comp19773_c0_seq1/g.23679  ORF comp19773_c0_seq1/g.23679 comp19773_c0_seq1/m.23679 type:complete len:424 (-) comp19773_c0_seq1:203-1474(-)